MHKRFLKSNPSHIFQCTVTAYLTTHHNLLTLPAFTAWLCRVFITSSVIEMLLSTYQFRTIKRGCFPWAEGSITSRLMTGRVPDCRQAPCTCFNCASFLYISAENTVCLLFFSKDWWNHRPEHLLDFSISFFCFCIWIQRRSCVISIRRWNAVFLKSRRGINDSVIPLLTLILPLCRVHFTQKWARFQRGAQNNTKP